MMDSSQVGEIQPFITKGRKRKTADINESRRKGEIRPKGRPAKRR